MHALPERPWRDPNSSSRIHFAMAFTSLALLAFIGAIDAPLLAPALPVRLNFSYSDKSQPDMIRTLRIPLVPRAFRRSG